VLSEWALHFEDANRHLILQKIILSTPLLAAEGFLILRIQIQGARTAVFPSSYDQLADQTGEFA
jgi:hypothetical protein